ncbi:phage protease [Pseudomonas aeruginosa]|nr:phage protease [Pseudomonas aeruginosa]
MDAQATNLAKLRETLGLAKDADVEQIAAATAQLKVAAPGNPDPAKYVPVEAVAQLQGQVAELTSRINGGELDGLINSAIQEGRLIPSMEPWAREYGAKDLAGRRTTWARPSPSPP